MTAGMSVAPPEHTACSGTASVLPPAPTVLSSLVHVNHEPASVLPPTPTISSSRVHINHEPTNRNETSDGGDLDEVGDDSGDEDKDEGQVTDEDDDMYVDEVPVIHFGPPKGNSGPGQVKSATVATRVDGNIFFFCYR